MGDQGVHVLGVSHGADGVGPADIIHTGHGHSPVANFALLDELHHDLCHSLWLHVGVYSVLIVQVDIVGVQTFQTLVHELADSLRAGSPH